MSNAEGDVRTKDGEEEYPHTPSAHEATPAKAAELSGSMKGDAVGAPAGSQPMGGVLIGTGQDYPINLDILQEIIERRNRDELDAQFGGVEGFAKIVKADLKDGISAGTVERRQEELGHNVLSMKEPVTFLEMLLDAFGDRVIQILSVAAIISIIFGVTLPNPYTGKVEASHGWIEGTAIIISILVVTLTGAIQNYKKAKKFEELERDQSVKPVTVVRDGKRLTIDSTDLVVGDILVLDNGLEMSCDGFLISGSDLRTNESPITGEPDLIEKTTDKDVFVVSGTSVEEGNGVVIVAAVGMNSFRGKLKEALTGKVAAKGDDDEDEEEEEEDDGTPLQQHLTKLGDDIGKLGLAGAVGLMLALSLKEVILITTDDKTANASQFLAFVIIAVTLIAVAIPEGLPLAVTISLAFAMSAMMKENCMVRILASCETMGAATAVCSDKTGTLTTNEMTVVQAMIAEKEFVLADYGVKPRHPDVLTIKRDALRGATGIKPDIIEKQVCYPLAINSTARQQTNDEGKLVFAGNKTEAGILGMVLALGGEIDKPRVEMHEGEYKQFPFSSLKKRMTTIVRRDGHLVAYIKGASENILEACNRYLDADGKEVDLSQEQRKKYEDIILDMAQQGNRTIGFGYHVTSLTSVPDEEPADMHFVFVGVLGIQDPYREEVPEALRECESAHLTVRMVTGDNINTAIAISKKIGLYDEARGDIAMTGPDFRKMFREDKQTLIDKLPNLRVLARSSPNDKYVLVGMLQDEQGEVVGVTGDGTNDAPALKLADVGFAMNTGTDIAKSASSMVLVDDNFATVVTAIKWGRSVNDNIKKFLQYQLAINAAGVGLTIIGSLASETSKEPIAPVQLLWLNLIMDTLAALSLSTETPEMACLTRLPVYKQAPLITNKMRSFIGIHGGYQLIIVLLVLFLGHDWFDTKESPESCTEVGGIYKPETGRCQQGRVHSTLLFNMFIWFQIFNVVNARKIYGEINCFEGLIDRSKIMICVFTLVTALQAFAVEVGGDALATTGLSWEHWLICIGFGASEWIVGLIVRLLPIHDYVPTKQEIIEAHLKEKKEKEDEAKEKEEKRAKAKAAREAKKKEKESSA